MVNEEIKKNIYKTRKLSKLSQEYVAEQLKISINSYRKIEKGSTQIINSRLNEIAGIIGVTTEQLLLGDNYLSDSRHHEIVEIKERHIQEMKVMTQQHNLQIVEKEKRIEVLEDLIRSKTELIEFYKEKIEKNKNS